MKDIKLFVSLVLTVIAFFVWIYYWKIDTEDKIENIKNEVKYVNLDIKKGKINIESKSENLIISVNWENIQEQVINLDEICE
jgi:hypothetical protein